MPLSFVHTKGLTIRLDCVSVLQVKQEKEHLARLATQGSLAYFLLVHPLPVRPSTADRRVRYRVQLERHSGTANPIDRMVAHLSASSFFYRIIITDSAESMKGEHMVKQTKSNRKAEAAITTTI